MWGGWVAAIALLVWLVWLFNSCVRQRNKAREAFSGVDVQLKRRHDLVPNLVKTVGAYARHEKQTLEDAIRARGAASDASSLGDKERSENGLQGSLDRLVMLVERYPELKADKNFRRLHEDLVEVEDHLQYARRYYNGSVRDFNTRIEQVPANFLAPLFGFRALEFFNLEDRDERRAPPVQWEEKT
ncbi:MAG: LemA family protein [Planctomycetota bacterium]|nr:LemA family protein [Planctomycetota bacterium]